MNFHEFCVAAINLLRRASWQSAILIGGILLAARSMSIKMETPEGTPAVITGLSQDNKTNVIIVTATIDRH